MKELHTGSATRTTNEAMEDTQGGNDIGSESRESQQSRAQIHSGTEGESGARISPKSSSASLGQDLQAVNRVDAPGLNVDSEQTEDSTQSMEKYALDNAPPPIKIRREGETSEESCPQDLSPPPSPKRVRELSRKDAINGLPFSKVFSQGSI